MQETWVRSLGREGPLKEEIATHSSILAWAIPRTKESGGLHSLWGHKELDTTERLTFFFHKYNHLVGISHKVSQFSLYISEKMHKT